MAAGFGAQEFLARANVAVSDEENLSTFETFSTRDSAEFPVSVFSGLGLATVFTLNAVLSQPISGFDYLPSRLDADGGSQANWKDRVRKRAT